MAAGEEELDGPRKRSAGDGNERGDTAFDVAGAQDDDPRLARST